MTKSRPAARAAVLIVSTALPGPVWADAASENMVRALIETIDKSADWQASAAGVASEGSATVVSGLKIAREDGSMTLMSGRLSLDSLAAADGGGIRIAAFSAPVIDIKGQGWAFQAKDFGGKGLKSPGFAGWTFDAKQPVASIARLYTRIAKTEFVEVVMPLGTLDYEMQTPGATGKTKAHAVYTNLRYDNLSNGILSNTSIEKMQSTTQIGTEPPATTIFAGLNFKATNFAAMARVFDPDAYANGKGDEQWIAAAEGGGYGRITIKMGDQETVTIGAVNVGRMEMRQPVVPFVPAIDELIAKGGKPSDAEMFEFFEKYASSFLGWFRFQSMEMKDLVAKPPAGGEIKLASIAAKDVSSDGLKSFAIAGFTADAPQFNGRLGLFEVADVTWPSLSTFISIAKLEESKKTGGQPDPALIETVASSFLDIIPKFGKIEISDVSAGIPGSEPFTLKSYLATNTGGMALLPKEAEVKLDTLVIPRGILRATPESADAFDQLGYNELTFHIDGKATHDDQSGAYATEANFVAEEAGSLRLSYGLGGLTLDNINAFLRPVIQSKDGNPDPAAMMMAISPLSISNFKLRYDDASLVKRLLPYVAKMQGTDEATLIGNTTAMLQLGLSQLKNPAFTRQAVESIGAFLKNPRSLTLSLKPAQPVQVLQLMQIDPNNTGAAIDLLGVSMTAND
jgi:hypothetical protein